MLFSKQLRREAVLYARPRLPLPVLLDWATAEVEVEVAWTDEVLTTTAEVGAT